MTASLGNATIADLHRDSSGGSNLDPSLRTKAEAAFDADFGDVRIHRDASADRASKALGARAFTVGQDIYFSGGTYAPDSAAGFKLLAHELTHTLQQPAGQVGTMSEKLDVSDPSDASETQAELVADQISSGAEIDAEPLLQSSSSAPVQRSVSPSMSDSRPLSADERNVAQFVFGSSLNVDPITIKESADLSIGGYVRTLPNTIYVAPGTKDTISMPLLVHELTHCAQYQHGVSPVVTLAHAIWAHYDYGGEQGLRDAITHKKCFDQFNTEQQADIVKDYYIKASSNLSTYPWSVFINQVRAQGACIWPNQPDQSPGNTPTPGRTGRPV